MNKDISNSMFYEVQPLLLCSKVNSISQKMINGIPDDIGFLSFEKFIIASGYDETPYNAIVVISAFTGISASQLTIKRCKYIIPTYYFYLEQINKYLEILKNINKKFEIPNKYSVSLQDNYGWLGLVKMLSGDDISKQDAILNMKLNDVIANVKMILDKNYSEYLKMKTK